MFTQFREITEPLAEYLGGIFGRPGLVLHGGTSVAKRQELVARFNGRTGPFFILSLKAGGTGLNLTAASHVIHFDRWWNPAVENQATDRAYRIGQKQPVLVHKFVCRGTVEEKIDELISAKSRTCPRPARIERRSAAQRDGQRPIIGNNRAGHPQGPGFLDHKPRKDACMSWWRFKEYVPVSKRRANAAREVAKLAKNGQTLSPVKIAGRCNHHDVLGQGVVPKPGSYSDFSKPACPRSKLRPQRLGRRFENRTGARHGHRQRIRTVPDSNRDHAAQSRRLAGGQSRLRTHGLACGTAPGPTSSVMDIVTRQDGGLFPKPREIEMSCSCPDWAGVCKIRRHALGVGARFDQAAENCSSNCDKSITSNS